MKTGKLLRYHLMAIFTVTVWGTTFVSTKVLINHGLTPVEIFFLRFLMAYLCIWFISPKKLWANNIKDELLLVGAGLSGGSLYFVAENSALGITLASNVSLIISVTPILTAFVLHLFYKEEKLKSNLILGSFIALGGVALVVFNGSFILKLSPLGDILTLIAALMWAFYNLILKRLNRIYPVIFITRKVFIYGVLTVIPFFSLYPIQINFSVWMQPAVWINLLFLGFVASLVCFIMWNATVKELGAIYTSNYLYLVPLVTLLTSAIVINEKITWIAIVGCLFILCGVYLAERNENVIENSLGRLKNFVFKKG